MKKVIIGIVSVVIIISGIICFNCIKNLNTEKKAALDVSSVQKTEKIEKKKQKQKEQSSDTKEEPNKQIEVSKDNNNVSEKKETTQKIVNQTLHQIKKKNLVELIPILVQMRIKIQIIHKVINQIM